jgi:hypothetical protein
VSAEEVHFSVTANNEPKSLKWVFVRKNEYNLSVIFYEQNTEKENSSKTV